MTTSWIGKHYVLLKAVMYPPCQLKEEGNIWLKVTDRRNKSMMQANGVPRTQMTKPSMGNKNKTTQLQMGARGKATLPEHVLEGSSHLTEVLSYLIHYHM
jgi:hypothetical protein